ncbi:MAG TPA: hypothetical protein V6D17_07685 [Candidatus Obscuribacterales bacterium]
MYNIEAFSLEDMTHLGSQLREMGTGAADLSETAQRIVRHLYRSFQLKDSGREAFALVRLFVTQNYSELDRELRGLVDELVFQNGERKPVSPETKCLKLLATVGELPEWSDPKLSRHHRITPLISSDLVARSPMIARLLQQFGLDLSRFLETEQVENGGIFVDQEQSSFNVFYVSDAQDSPYIHAQTEFVIPFGIKSVLGYGGVLSAGHIFAVILFSRAPISKDMAQRFKPLALSTKNALIHVSGTRVQSTQQVTK